MRAGAASLPPDAPGCPSSEPSGRPRSSAATASPARRGSWSSAFSARLSFRVALKDAERTGAYVNRNDFFETAELVIAPLEETFAAQVAAAVEARLARLQAQQTGVLGIQRVLQQSPFDRPKMSARTRMPLAFSSARETYRAFANGWYAFVAAFRDASEKFRNGALTVPFPMFSFRPYTPAT